MNNKEPEYVYILTNPSFHENWVKDRQDDEYGEAAEDAKYYCVSRSLSVFCGTYLPEHMHNASEAYQGPKYFSYQGKTLWEIRIEKESIK